MAGLMDISVYNRRNLDDHRCPQLENLAAFFFQLSTIAFQTGILIKNQKTTIGFHWSFLLLITP